MEHHYIQLSGKLFERVQLNHVFTDSKTFVDCYPRYDPSQIIELYQLASQAREFNLHEFIAQNFIEPPSVAHDLNLCPGRSLEEHIAALWPILMRAPNVDHSPHSSFIPLPEAYIAPGGRFNEIYYWDSYFTAEGLAVSGYLNVVSQLVKNFAYLISRCGFIPNGNRVYYLSRSQPPFFCALVKLLYRYNGVTAILDYLPLIEIEYNYWMSGERKVELGSGLVLNRYWDEHATPRPESYKEDISLASVMLDKPRFYRNIRAACESGWDFSSRWLLDEHNLASINTTDILPVDLNAILFDIEHQLALWFCEVGELAKASWYALRAANRQVAVNHYFWDKRRGFYFDYNWVLKRKTAVWSLAAVYPLFFQLAAPAQAQQVALHLHKQFLQAGGLLTTLTTTRQQWDSPNGWAPLHWLAIVGLRNYGLDKLAQMIATCFINNVRTIFGFYGRIMEKYNVCDLSKTASGGEYPLQDGFGWTNGVVAALLALYPSLSTASEQGNAVGKQRG